MVARETVLAKGLELLGVSADAAAIERLSRLAQMLETEGMERGYLARGEQTKILPRHILESAALQRWLPGSGRLLDVGSGAGLPGLVLACLRSDPVTLIEPMAKRAAFLRVAIHELDLTASVLVERAESIGQGEHRESAPAVCSRALADVPVALELMLPLVCSGGVAAILIGERDVPPSLRLDAPMDARAAPSQGRSPADVAADELGGGPPAFHGFEVPGLEERRWVMIVRKIRRAPDRFPRSMQAIRRSPLGR